jgi:CheY-like chemotaxis protein
VRATHAATILVVEDEPALRRTVRRVLEERLGYRLVLAERAEEALGRIELGQHVGAVRPTRERAAAVVSQVTTWNGAQPSLARSLPRRAWWGITEEGSE